MATKSNLSIGLCPINFSSFGRMNSEIKNMEASLLLSKIKFDLTKSILTNKDGKTYIARSREQLASWFGFNVKKVSRLLTLLEEKNAITKKISMWKGKKTLYISSDFACEHIPINFKILNHLYHHFSSIKESIIFSKIAFSFNNTTIEHDKKRWCALAQTQLANWSGFSIRTINKIIKSLTQKGFILKKNFSFKGRVKAHFHITTPAFKILSIQHNQQSSMRQALVNSSIEVIHTQNCQSQPAKSTSSIKRRTKRHWEVNNTVQKQPTSRTPKSDITLNKISTELTSRQKRFLAAALERTCDRHHLRLSNPKHLLAELKYFILNQSQRLGVSTFRHAVNRSMKILSDRNWRTPFGFTKYSAQGKTFADKALAREKAWEKMKEAECQRAMTAQPSSVEPLSHFLGEQNQELDDPENIQQKAKSLLTQIKRYKRTEKSPDGGFALRQTEKLMNSLYGLLREGLNAAWLKTELSRLTD